MHGQPGPGRRPPGPPRPNPFVASQQEAADAVQRAYDALGRSAALSQTVPSGTAVILAQGKDAYQQALSQYQASNFVGARESAMAAADFARAAEQIASANLLEAATGQAQLPAPPSRSSAATQTARAYQDLARVSEHSARLTGELSAAPAVSSTAQVRQLLEQSGRLQQRAQSFLTANRPEQASAMARASDALLAAADHIEQRALIASGVIRAQSAPSPSPPPAGGPAGPPPPPTPGDPNGPPPLQR